MAGTVVIFGGSGFLGSAICRRAVLSGLRVISISRSGAPPAGLLSQAWTRAPSMEWRQGDCLDKTSYAYTLEEIARLQLAKEPVAVVHSVGALLENSQYKILLDPLRGQHPQARETEDPLYYESINRDSLIAVASEVHDRLRTSVGGESSPPLPFVFISAFATPPMVDTRYLSTKREAEDYLFNCDNLRPVVFRPGFMYSEQRPVSMALAGILNCTSSSSMQNPIGGMLSAIRSFLPGQFALDSDFASLPPVRTDTVAEAVLYGTRSEEIRGVYEDYDIEELANSV